MTNKCSCCKEIIDGLPFKCKYCGKYFCSKHRLPENHNCKPFKEHESHNQERWQNVVESSLNYNADNYVKKRKVYVKKKKRKTKEIPWKTLPPLKEISLPKKQKKKTNKTALIILVVIIFAVIYLLDQGKIQDYFFGILSFLDISDNSLESKNMSSLVFEGINEVRENKTIRKLKYNKNSYNLAVAISKKFYESEIYSLKDSELEEMSKLYKVDNVKFLTRKLDKLNKSNFDMLSYDWTTRNLFTENTLNAIYTHGAVGCYNEVCILILNIDITPTLTYDYDVNYETTDNYEEEKDDGGFIQGIIEEGENIINELVGEDPEKYKTNPKTIKLYGVGDYIVYQGLNDYLSGLDDSISYYYNAPTTKDFIIKDLDNNIQKEYLLSLVDKIKEKSSNSNEQARITIRMVQGIPYDYDGLYGIPEGRLPYEVLYDMEGVCGEKSLLLAFLLRELEYGVAIFEFEGEDHRAVGIRCDNGNYGSNYCFIESTDYYPIGQIPFEYVGGVNIKNAIPEIIIISDGNKYE